MKRIPIAAARRIAEDYGYDQVMIYARKVGDMPDPHGDHMTTYGVNTAHCAAMAKVAKYLQTKIMGWHSTQITTSKPKRKPKRSAA